MVYDYLFYKNYQLAAKSKDWKDTRLLFATMVIGWGLILNFSSILFLVEALSKKAVAFGPYISRVNDIRHILGIVLLGVIWMYYTHKNRWKKIISRYEVWGRDIRNIHPAIIVIVACVLSLVVGMLSAMYRNGDGVFK